MLPRRSDENIRNWSCIAIGDVCLEQNFRSKEVTSNV
jgi:hypothetical protein